MLRHLFKYTGMLCLALAADVSAANITLQGSFTQDDGVQLFDLVVVTPAAVDIRTSSYAGGGFDPVLTLFDSAGAFITDNDDGFGVGMDPITGQASDARITLNFATGNYIVALTQFDNFSIGNLADGFAESGNSHFTANSNFATGGPCPGNLFRDASGTAGRCRDGNWTVDFLNVASVSERAPSSVPEPATILMVGPLLACLGFGLRRRLFSS